MSYCHILHPPPPSLPLLRLSLYNQPGPRTAKIPAQSIFFEPPTMAPSRRRQSETTYHFRGASSQCTTPRNTSSRHAAITPGSMPCYQAQSLPGMHQQHQQHHASLARPMMPILSHSVGSHQHHGSQQLHQQPAAATLGSQKLQQTPAQSMRPYSGYPGQSHHASPVRPMMPPLSHSGGSHRHHCCHQLQQKPTENNINQQPAASIGSQQLQQKLQQQPAAPFQPVRTNSGYPGPHASILSLSYPAPPR
jgi:hypothetical protein